jgi:hypothetical protein
MIMAIPKVQTVLSVISMMFGKTIFSTSLDTLISTLQTTVEARYCSVNDNHRVHRKDMEFCGTKK